MKSIISVLLALVIICGATSCRKPRRGDFEMVLSGETVTTTNNSSGSSVSITQYASTVAYHIQKTKKTSMEVGDMLWAKSGDKVTYASTNVSVGAFASGNWGNAMTETLVNAYEGTIKNNNSVEGTFSFSRTRVDSNTEEVVVTTGTFILQRK
jgi:hypothetical protein